MSANIFFSASAGKVWVNGAFLQEGCPFLGSRQDGLWLVLEHVPVTRVVPSGNATVKRISTSTVVHVSVGGARVYSVKLSDTGCYHLSTKGGSLMAPSGSLVKSAMDAFGLPRNICRQLGADVDEYTLSVYHKYPARPNSADYDWFETDGAVTLSQDDGTHAATATIRDFTYIMRIRVGVGPDSGTNHVKTVLYKADSVSVADRIVNKLFKYLARR